METEQQKEILKIIKLYRQYECLWNINCKYFRSIDMKKRAYQRIAFFLGKNEAYIKKKITNLRGVYTAARRKMAVSLKAGIDRQEPSLFYFKEMSFLDPHILARTYNGSLLVSSLYIHTSLIFTIVY